MAETPSTMLPLGTPAPDFRLPDVISGNEFTLADFEGASALLVMFICNHCPFVVHVRDGLTRVASAYAARGVASVAINANSLQTHPEDGPEHMKALARQENWSFPFLFDASQDVAKAYRAACTPDLFVFDASLRLAYRGRLDASRPGNDVPVTGNDLRNALDDILAGRPVAGEQLASIGCNIKWHPGQEPGF